MRLKKARITDFRCVEDSGQFTLDDVTCLVGKNEAGKTALLQALYRLKPYDLAGPKFDRERDYPRRHLLSFDERHKDGRADAVATDWELDDGDVKAVEAILGPGALKSRSVNVSAGFGYDGTYWQVQVDEQTVISNLAAQHLHTEEAEPIKNIASINDLSSYFAKLPARSPRQETLIASINAHFSRGTARLAAIDLLASRLPTFVYFSQYERMPGQVSLEALQAKVTNSTTDENDRVFLAFVRQVGATLNDLATVDRFESLIAKLESASIRISDEIFKYWTQNRHLKVLFRLDQAQPGDPPPFNSGKILRTRVFNAHHQVSVSFDDRSTGFVWFFSFLVLFSQVKKEFGDNLVILLDEPGLSLHAKAQSDLLRYIEEKLQPHHQVVYSTHSPFMVPTKNLMRVRTVEDVVIMRDGETIVEGTKVGDDVLSTDRDTIFPLQGALGYEITQTLFVGEHTLLVEGPSDLLYLKAFSEELGRKGRTRLDKLWSVCPTNGIDKVHAFMSLFGGNKLHVAVLADMQKGHKRKIDEVRRSHLLREKHVLTVDAYANQPEADIEDVIGAEAYVELVNQCYSLTAPHAIAAPALRPGERIVPQIEEACRLLPPATPEFDHFAPAVFLIERPPLFKSLPRIADALDRFEQLFAELNSLLL